MSEDRQVLDTAFEAAVERGARNDSTCTLADKVYEVPAHLRGRVVVPTTRFLANLP